MRPHPPIGDWWRKRGTSFPETGFLRRKSLKQVFCKIIIFYSIAGRPATGRHHLFFEERHEMALTTILLTFIAHLAGEILRVK
jgi:hypothetical protein